MPFVSKPESSEDLRINSVKSIMEIMGQQIAKDEEDEYWLAEMKLAAKAAKNKSKKEYLSLPPLGQKIPQVLFGMHHNILVT